MIQFHFTSRDDLERLTSKRNGETKLGETLELCDSLDEISRATARYVIFGICEDIGVQANYGRPGTDKAWDAFLLSFVNCQENIHNQGNHILLLGHISVTPDIDLIDLKKPEVLGNIVNRIDTKVAKVVEIITSANKIPIIIGGGHNNAYGAISGVTSALKMPIHCINFDAHTDLRKTDYRHSGNGFSKAIEHPEGSLLTSYHIFGLHKNYTPQYILKRIENDGLSRCYYLEDMLLEQEQVAIFTSLMDSLPLEPLGVEIDCDSLINFSSSAQSPSGFKLEVVRYFLIQLAAYKTCNYLHICEALPTKKNRSQIGKALTYLVTDFIRTHSGN